MATGKLGLSGHRVIDKSETKKLITYQIKRSSWFCGKIFALFVKPHRYANFPKELTAPRLRVALSSFLNRLAPRQLQLLGDR